MNSNVVSYNPQTGQPIYSNQNNNLTPNNNLNKPKNGSNLKLILYVMISILALLLIAIGVVVVSQKNNGTTRTFMIYMVGSDLESKNSMGTYELDGIDPSLVDLENTNVVLIAGGSSTWGNDYINPKETSIYQLTREGFKKVKQQKIKNMGDSNTLSDFINFITKKYITDKYELLFWNHGGAILGSEYDELSNNDNLSLQEIRAALTQTQFNKSNKIETVIFSTCLNGTIENANIFKEYADYFVASEEISMSVKNTSDFSFINEVTPKTQSLEIGRKFIEKYKAKMSKLKSAYQFRNMDYNIYSTYSIVDLNNLDNLNNSVNSFFADVDISKNYNLIARVRSNAYQYAYKQTGEAGYDTVDLYNLVSNLKEISPKKADKVLTELKNTIIYNYSTDSSSRGISIYFPYNATIEVQDMFLKMYDEISTINNYNKFIKNFSSFKLTNSANKLSFVKNKTNIKSEKKESDFELELTEEQVENYAKAQYLVFRDNKNGTYLPVYRGTEVNLDNNKLSARIKDRQLKIGDDEYQRIITLIEDESTDDYIKYSTYGMLDDFRSNEIYEWKNDNVKISIVLDKKTNKVQLTDAILMSGNSLPSKISVNLKDYTNMELGSTSYKIFDENNQFNENWDKTSNGIFEGIDVDLTKDYKIELEDYSDGYDYYCTFKIYDVNNNYYYSPLVKMK